MISGGGIGIAPLMDSEFNRAKSPIKFFDYTALGLTSVCSDLSVYQGVVRNANNGMLCENSVEAWFDSLCRLIDNPDFSYGLYKQAHKELWENYTLAKVTGLRADALVRLQREKGRLPLNTVVGEAV